MSDRFRTMNDFSQDYRVSRATIYRWIREGKLNEKTGLCRMGGRTMIDRVLFEAAFIQRKFQRIADAVLAFLIRLGVAALPLHHVLAHHAHKVKFIAERLV